MSVPFRSCVHTHTNFCDGKDAPETMVKRALELGFVSLGFSGHGPTFWDEFAMKTEDMPLYRAELERLRQVYGEQIEILIGVEHDSLGDMPGDGFDYVIESVHAFEKDGQLCYVDWSPERLDEAIRLFGDPYDYARAYYEACAAAYEKSPAIIAGHLDLLTKFNERSPLLDLQDPRYLDAAFLAMDCALEKGMVLELNTGAISRGYRTTPYPDTAILRRMVEKHAPIIVTSDCHDARYLDCWYTEAAELLKSVGFRSTLRLRKSGVEEIPL